MANNAKSRFFMHYYIFNSFIFMLNGCYIAKSCFNLATKCPTQAVADPENFGGGGFEAKTSKIRMSSPKLRVIFRPKSEIQTFFFAQNQVVSKKKKKKKKKKKNKKGLNKNWDWFFGRIRYV